MNGYTRETKRVYECLVLGGLTLEKRRMRSATCMAYGTTHWFITLPLQNYVTGPWFSKTAAIQYAAAAMELDVCLILKQMDTTTKRSRSASPSAAWSSFATSPDKPDVRWRASPKLPSKMPS